MCSESQCWGVGVETGGSFPGRPAWPNWWVQGQWDTFFPKSERDEARGVNRRHSLASVWMHILVMFIRPSEKSRWEKQQLSSNLAVESSLLLSLNICQTLQHPDINQFYGFPLCQPPVHFKKKVTLKWLTHSLFPFFLSQLFSVYKTISLCLACPSGYYSILCIWFLNQS